MINLNKKMDIKKKTNDYKILYKIPPLDGRYVIFDIETTGLNSKDHLIQLAAVEIENRQLTTNKINIYIKPRVLIRNKKP